MDVTITREPSDLPVRTVEADDLFFSTTDDKGVILSVNEVFSRLAAGELVGQPHNVIRHPDMPGGAFHLMWAMLEEGRPFVGYVRNKSIDDHTYDVLATVVPLADGGYLSVRISPSTDYFATAGEIYYAVNDLENWVKREGTNRREAAALGAKKIRELVRDSGFSNYEQLQWLILPAEVAAREERGTIPDSPVLDALGEFMDFQQEIAATVGTLKATAAELGRTATQDVQHHVDSLDLPEAELQLRTIPLRMWINLQGIIDEHVADLHDLLDALDTSSARTRFDIALARLHATVSAENPSLHTVMRAGVDRMIETHHQYQSLTRRVTQKARSVASLIAIPRELIVEWLQTYDAAEVRDAVEAANRRVETLTSLAESLEAMTAPSLQRLDEALS
ncbi:PAS domain-containing protein [Corynebacterium uterequi]|uniref:PAS domain n=1 Tax=Corynebacterium uterequi TaxID=1072256 RepID=A0A0G3HH15_9CORY|nr:hypothetical protein [Corynebacterium uterequi]AKK10447.1 PAS domain [Corynebacterium uterequi]